MIADRLLTPIDGFCTTGNPCVFFHSAKDGRVNSIIDMVADHGAKSDGANRGLVVSTHHNQLHLLHRQ